MSVDDLAERNRLLQQDVIALRHALEGCANKFNKGGTNES